jgi:hypothetical protein
MTYRHISLFQKSVKLIYKKLAIFHDDITKIIITDIVIKKNVLHLKKKLVVVFTNNLKCPLTCDFKNLFKNWI